jgi:thiol-disulfide isomerase/thioredoxin
MKNFFFALLFAVSIVPVANAQVETSAELFTDVSVEHEFFDAIEYVKDNGFVQGYVDGSYQPETAINRYDFVKILIEARMDAEAIANCDIAENAFPDVPQDQWFSPYVCMARSSGVVNGYGDGTFRGQENITLAESAKVLLEAFDIDTSANAGTQWYEEYVATAAEMNLIANIGNDINYNITRGDMAEMIYQLAVSMYSDEEENDMEMDEEMETEGDDSIDTPMEEEMGGEMETDASMGADGSTEAEGEVSGETEGDTEEDTSSSNVLFPVEYTAFSREAFNEAKGSKPVALFFHAAWCPQCVKLDGELSSELGDLPNDAVIYRVDFDSAEDLRAEYSVTSQTTVVFLDQNGNVIDRKQDPSVVEISNALTIN